LVPLFAAAAYVEWRRRRRDAVERLYEHKRCTKCGYDVRYNERRCPECGDDLVAQVVDYYARRLDGPR
jgi:rubrerythrin